jgi:hypothetical protein
MENANEPEKYEIKRKAIEFYRQQVKRFETGNYNSSALKIYEVLVTLVVDAEKIEMKKKILNLYQRLGKVKEYLKLKAELEGIRE